MASLLGLFMFGETMTTFQIIGGALIGIFVSWGIKPVNSLVVAAVIFLIWEMAVRPKQKA